LKSVLLKEFKSYFYFVCGIPEKKELL